MGLVRISDLMSGGIGDNILVFTVLIKNLIILILRSDRSCSEF